MLHPIKLMHRSPDHYTTLTWHQYRRLFNRYHSLGSTFFTYHLHFCLSSFARFLFQAYNLLWPEKKTHQTKANIKPSNTFPQQQLILLSSSSYQNPCILHICFLEHTTLHCPMGETRQPLCSQLTHRYAYENQTPNSYHDISQKTNSAL